MAVDLSRVNKNSAMGATVRSDGTGFRTWAPNAKTVSVVAGSALAVIDEPPWRPASEDNLAALGDGSWGGFLAGVGDGDPYMFFVEGAARPIPRRSRLPSTGTRIAPARCIRLPRGSASTPSLATACGMLCVTFSGRQRPVRRRHWIFPRWRTPLLYRLPFPGAGVSCNASKIRT